MFWFRDSLTRPGGGASSSASGEGGVRVDVAFTDASLDLRGLLPGFPAELDRLEQACGVRFARLSQVHGDEVLVVDAPHGADGAPSGDALVTGTSGVGLMVRAADCVPLVLADPHARVVGVAHAGRPGMVLDVATRTVEAMVALGATPGGTTAWLGPHVCGGCYEVPEQLREQVCAAVPEAYAHTTWGTPSVDIGVGVRAQLERAGVGVVDVAGCTREEPRLPSYRRDGAGSGRLAGLVWLS